MRAAEVELTMAEHADRSNTMAAVVEGEVSGLEAQLREMAHKDPVGATALRAKKAHLQQLSAKLKEDAAAPDKAKQG